MSLEGHLQFLLPSEATEGGTTDAEEGGEVREIPTSCFATFRDDDDGGGGGDDDDDDDEDEEDEDEDDE